MIQDCVFPGYKNRQIEKILNADNRQAISFGPVPKKKSLIPPLITRMSDIIRAACILGPDNGIIHVNEKGNEHLQTYSDLMHSSKCVLSGLRGKGLKPGNKVILQLEDPALFLSAFWGSILGGFIPVPLPLPNGYPIPEGMDRLAGVSRVIDNFCIVTDQEREVFRDLEGANLFGIVELLGSRPDNCFYKTGPDEPVLIQYSSGSTGDPKGVILTQVNLLSSIDAGAIMTLSSDPNDIRPVLGYSLFLLKNRILNIHGRGIVSRAVSRLSDLKIFRPGTKSFGLLESLEILSGNKISPEMDIAFDELSFVNWMPYSHDMGLIGFHISPMLTGMSQVNLSTRTFIENPSLFLKLIDRYRATHVPCPNFAMQWLTSQVRDEDIKNIDLSSIKALYNGSEPISSSVTRSFINKFKQFGLKRESIRMAYGMAEASLQISMPPINSVPLFHKIDRNILMNKNLAIDASEDKDSIELADLGYPVSYMTVRITDDNDELLNENMIGHIQIKGMNVTSGYFNDIDTNADLFCGEWLRTGDMGFIRDGRIIVTGRYKDIIFINGRNIYSNDIEEYIRNIPGFRFVHYAVCGITDVETGLEKVILFARSGESRQHLLRMLLNVNSRLQKSFGFTLSSIVKVPELPLTPGGKIKRYRLRNDFIKGLLKDEISPDNESFTVVNMDMNFEPQSQTEIVLLGIFSEVLGKPDLTRYDKFFELGGNSIGATKVISRIRDEFRIDLSIAAIFEMQTVESLSDMVEKAIKHKKRQLRSKESGIMDSHFTT
jgi:acyl-CoA synthetase (AMP-forming)/AMP-acid ligase II/acyl carrier protein